MNGVSAMTSADLSAPPRIVASRVFRDQAGKAVVATLYEPVAAPPDEWVCEFRISGSGSEVVSYARGVDSLQALMVAVQGIRFHLDRAGEALTWFGGEAGAFGIPHPIPNYYGVVVERRLEKLVSEEVMRLAEERVAAKRADREAQAGVEPPERRCPNDDARTE